MDGEKVIAKGLCERIGCEGGRLEASNGNGKKYVKEVDMPDHTVAFLEVKNALLSGECKVIDDLSEITAIGHRVVQGGSLFNKSVLIDDEVIKGIESLIDLAPLHNAATFRALTPARRFSEKMFPRSPFSITRSTAPCLPRHIFPIPYGITRSTR